MNPTALAEPVPVQAGDIASPVPGAGSIAEGTTMAGRGLEQMANVPLTVVFELARTTITAARLLGLAPGTIIPLGPVDVDEVTMLVDGQRLGVGEITLCGENFGVRVSELGEGPAEERR